MEGVRLLTEFVQMSMECAEAFIDFVKVPLEGVRTIIIECDKLSFLAI